MKKIFIASFLFLLVIMLEWLRHPLPIYEGALNMKPLKKKVEVYTDSYGVPHIFADNEPDLFFVAGYIAARDRLFQLSMVRLAVRGSLSSVLGDKYLGTDIYLRTWRIHHTAKKLVQNMSPINRKIFEDFCRGINHRIKEVADDLPIEFKILGFKPEEWDPSIVAGYTRMMAHEMSGSWMPEAVFGAVGQYFGRDKVLELIPESDIDYPTIVEYPERTQEFFDQLISSEKTLRNLFGSFSADIGSNNWVLSGEKTKSGKPLLANDPHLAFTQPPRWYEIRLKGGRFNVSGVCIAGIPMPVIGQNQRVAWGFTNTMVDDLDFFIEKVNDDGSMYLEEGEWKNFTTLKEVIKIKGESDSTIVIRSTGNGPVISDIHPLYKKTKHVVSFSWTGHWITNEMDAWISLTTMENWKDFTRAVKKFGVPGQNIVYADVDGNIGWRPAVYIPIRKEGYSMLPRPGHKKSFKWKGRVPFEDMPFLYNPTSGYISTANNRTIDKNFMYYISGLWADPSRADVIKMNLDTIKDATVKDMMDLQLSYQSNLAKKLVPLMIPEKNKNFNDGHNRALKFLLEWDYIESPESEAALIFHTMLLKLTENIFGDELNLIGPDYLLAYKNLKYLSNRKLRSILDGQYCSWVDNINTKGKVETIEEIVLKSFLDACEHINTHYGPNWSNWKWGNAHQVTHKHTLGDVPGLNLLLNLNVGPFKSGGSDGTPNAGGYSRSIPFIQTSGASMRRIVDFSNLNESKIIIPTGQSGLPNSPHYQDQAALYNNGLYRTTNFDSDFIKNSEEYRKLVLYPN